jgi:RNAse (barnase) inhibitor barstar
MSEKIYIFDGLEFADFQEFVKYFSKIVLIDWEWNGNLDAFNDILRGGFGTPDEGFTILWKNSNISREKLGYVETVKLLKERGDNCHPSNISYFQEQLEQAKQNSGETIFDAIVKIIQIHGIGGDESEDNVKLILD